MGQVTSFSRNLNGYYSITVDPDSVTSSTGLSVNITDNKKIPYSEYIKGEFYRIKCDRSTPSIFMAFNPSYNIDYSNTQEFKGRNPPSYNSSEPTYIFIHKETINSMNDKDLSEFIKAVYVYDFLRKEQSDNISNIKVPDDYKIDIEPCTDKIMNRCKVTSSMYSMIAAIVGAILCLSFLAIIAFMVLRKR